jgi:hypothetical protein
MRKLTVVESIGVCTMETAVLGDETWNYYKIDGHMVSKAVYKVVRKLQLQQLKE